MEEDIAVNTQGNALFCTILCSWKCRVPFCFESPLFVCLLMTCFSQKIIDKLNNFLLAFCWWYILMMSLVSKVCSIFLFEQRLNLTTELILSSWSHVIAYVHANLFMLCVWFVSLHYAFFFSVLFAVSALANEQAFIPPFSLFAHTYSILQVKMKNNQNFVL